MNAQPDETSKRIARPWSASRPCPPPRPISAGKAVPAKAHATIHSSVIALDINEQVRRLVDLSKKQGYVTVKTINEVIPDSATDPELIENIMNILDNLDIKLLDEDEVETYRTKINDVEEEAALALSAVEPYDPFEIFLRQLGRKPLLTREQEVGIAKRIEDAELRVQDLLFSCWLTLPFQRDLALKILRGQERFKKVVNDKRVESRDAYLKMLPRGLEDSDNLVRKLDTAWQRYLDETDQAKKGQALERYRRIEREPRFGCKDVLRRFCFKLELFESWLDLQDIKGDIEDARSIVRAKISPNASAGSSPSPFSRLFARRSREIEQRWRLTPAELVHLHDNVRKYLDEWHRAREELIVHNFRLVIAIAKKYAHSGLPLEDLIQEGNIGLVKAASRFEYRRGYKFSTYATWWIREAIIRALAAQARELRIPVHMISTLSRAVQAYGRFIDELGYEPSSAEIADEMNMTVARVHQVLLLANKHLSLDSPLGEHFYESLPEQGFDDFSDSGEILILREKINRVLRSLPEREQEVLILRFGLLDGVCRTLDEVARHFRVTRERIRLIEASALRNLRHPSLSRILTGFDTGYFNPYGDDPWGESDDDGAGNDEGPANDAPQRGPKPTHGGPVPPGSALFAFFNGFKP